MRVSILFRVQKNKCCTEQLRCGVERMDEGYLNPWSTSSYIQWLHNLNGNGKERDVGRAKVDQHFKAWRRFEQAYKECVHRPVRQLELC